MSISLPFFFLSTTQNSTQANRSQHENNAITIMNMVGPSLIDELVGVVETGSFVVVVYDTSPAVGLRVVGDIDGDEVVGGALHRNGII